MAEKRLLGQRPQAVELQVAETLTQAAAQIKKIIIGLGPWEWIILVSVLLVGVLFFGSRASGWHKLAGHYPRLNPFQGEWISMPDFFGKEGRGGMTVDFNNCQTNAINLAVDGQGMYLSMSIAFRLFHPPIFVPWSDVRSVALAACPWSDKITDIRFTFALSPDVPLDVDLEVAAEIQKRAQGRWTMPKDVCSKKKAS